MVAAGVTAPARAAKPQTASAPTPNVNFVIINFDDVGYGDFSCSGAIEYETPNIDRVASRGMRFTHFLSAQPISGASRMGLMTGCYPNRLSYAGAPGPGARIGIAAEEETMGEMLKKIGYATAVYGKWHLGNRRQFLPLQNGFDEYYGLPYSNDMGPRPGNTNPPIPLYHNNDVVARDPDQSRLTTDYTTYATNFIRDHRGGPFFIYLAHTMAHVPLAVSDKFKGKSRQGMYGDVMMEIDWSVGEIMRTLEQYGLDKNTFVMITSDNGPSLFYGNHAGSAGGLRQGKATTFEGGNRVPCIMMWPGTIPAGTVCNRLASQIDMLPTVAEISGAPLPSLAIDGVSILPLMKGDARANPREHFAFWFNRNDLEAVTDGHYKLIFPHRHRDYTAYTPGSDGRPGKSAQGEVTRQELYDLRRDPGERYDVIEMYPEVAERLNAYAETMRKKLGDNLTKTEGSEVRPSGVSEE